MDGVLLVESRCPPVAELALHDCTVGEALRVAAQRWPDAEVLVEALPDGTLARRWTFAALSHESDALAHALLTRFSPGERIAVWAPNTPEWVLLEFAAARAGLVLVTANPAFQARELDYVLRQSGAVGLFLVRTHRGNPMAQIAAQVVAQMPGLREIVDMENRDALFRCAGDPTLMPPKLPDVTGRDTAQIQFTSGTTGFPRGVQLRHGGLTDNARHFFALAGIGAGATHVLVMPFFHTGGCALSLLGAVQAGCRSILPRQFDPALVLALMAREGAQALLGVPAMIQAVLDGHAADPVPLPALRIIGSGGAIVPAALAHDTIARFACRFVTVYGQTEASPLLAMTRPDDSRADRFETVGRAMPHVELSIRDVASGAVLPLGASGEVCAAGYGVMLGYHGDAPATASAIDPRGWLRTGDLGAMDAQGYVRITGRIKDMIIRGGENLYPAEIEAVLREHPAVAEVAVVGVPDRAMGEAVAAFVQCAPGRPLDPAALIVHCRALLAAQKTPAHWIAVESWPLTGSGKIRKYTLRDAWIAEQGEAD